MSRKLILKETYSGLVGELFKLTGKDIKVTPCKHYPDDRSCDLIYNYLVCLNGEKYYHTKGHLTRVKKSFWNWYQERSWELVWKYEKKIKSQIQ